MSLRSIALVVPVALVALAGCSSGIIADPGTSYGPRGRGAVCDAAAYRYIVGQPRTVLRRAELPGRARLIGPGTAVTMDHDPGRLNVRHDARGVIRELYCG